MKIDSILGTGNITTKDGRSLKKTQFLSGNQVFYTFSDIKAGDEREEESRSEFKKQDGTSEVTIKFKSNATSGRSGFGGYKSDPDTMLISYAKDLTVAFINAGVIKGEANAATQMRNFATLIFALYKQHKEGKSILPKEKPKDENKDEVFPEAAEEE